MIPTGNNCLLSNEIFNRFISVKSKQLHLASKIITTSAFFTEKNKSRVGQWKCCFDWTNTYLVYNLFLIKWCWDRQKTLILSGRPHVCQEHSFATLGNYSYSLWCVVSDWRPSRLKSFFLLHWLRQPKTTELHWTIALHTFTAHLTVNLSIAKW